MISVKKDLVLTRRGISVRSVRKNAGTGRASKRFGIGATEVFGSRMRGKTVRNASSVEDAVVDEGFSITRVSFGTIGLVTGVSLLVYGFGAYFELLPGGSLSALMLIYGFPATIVGFALKYAELKPVRCKATKRALELRETKATDIQKQVRQDTTRYRYGDEQHLEEALERIFRYGKAEGIPRRYGPELRGLREEEVDGEYALILEFESPRLTAEQWLERQPKFQSFFGPGIVARMEPVPGGMDVSLITDGTGAGREGKEQAEVLPPLMPGMPARRQDS